MNVIIFIFSVLIFLLIPGIMFVRKIGFPLKSFFNLNLAAVVGSLCFIYFIFVVRSLGLSFNLLYGWGGLSLVYAYMKRRQIWQFIRVTKVNFYSVISMLILIILQAGSLPKTYIKNGDLFLPAAQDALWRLSIIGELTHSFPPQHPGFAGENLTNYHFLYDLFIAALHKLTYLNIILLYTKYTTWLSALFFVLSIYNFLAYFIQNKNIVIYGTILTVFTGNLSYILPIISPQYNFISKANIFMSDQPFDQSHNPFNLFTYAAFLTVCLLVLFWLKQKKLKKFWILGLCLAVLPGVKIYGAVLLFLGISTVLIYNFLLKRKLILVGLLPFVLTLPIVNSMRGNHFSILVLNPGWLLIKMIEDLDRLFWPDMALKEAYYKSVGNYFRLIQLKITQLTVYFLGNLNVRIIGLLILSNNLRLKYFPQDQIVFIGSLIFSAFAIPLLFSQSRAAYDSIQFTPYGLLLLSLLLVFVIKELIDFIKNRASRYAVLISCLILGLITTIAVPTYLLNLNLFSFDGFTKISQSELAGLTYLNNTADTNDVILTDLTGEKNHLMYVSALSERRTYLSGIKLVQQVGINPLDRQREVDMVFQGELDASDYLRDNQIAYVYLSGEGRNYGEIFKRAKLPVVYSNDLVEIYKVN